MFRTLPKLMLLGGLVTMAVSVCLMVSGEASAALDPAYVAECGSCHVAYPPRFLGAASWRQVLGDLHDHFGTDASVAETGLAPIERYLGENARRRETFTVSGQAARRISESVWFVREHDEISAATWRAASSKANCSACHRGAEQGDYSEYNVRLPQRGTQ